MSSLFRLVLLDLGVLFIGCAAMTQPMTEAEFEQQRKDLVVKTIALSVSDQRVLDAMLRVPRHRFVPERLWPYAYNNEPLPIGEGQTISQPSIVASMTEALQLRPTDRVLEIGTGSGYQAAVLAELAAHVYTIEIVPLLARHAEKTLAELGVKNISFRIGDGYAGWPEEAPFDKIILTAAPLEVPKPLLDQLAEGGKLIAPVGKDTQHLIQYQKVGGRVTSTQLSAVRFVPMTGRAQSFVH